MGVSGWEIHKTKHEAEGEILAKPAGQDSCWKEARAIRYQGWQVRKWTVYGGRSIGQGLSLTSLVLTANKTCWSNGRVFLFIVSSRLDSVICLY